MLNPIFRLISSIPSKIAHRPILRASNVQALGAEGDDVRVLQQVLNRRGRRYGVSVEVTGVYDQQTQDSVRRLQLRAMDISNSDGFIGPQTAKFLRIKLVDQSTDVW